MYDGSFSLKSFAITGFPPKHTSQMIIVGVSLNVGK
jgi:hypothetical protein